MADKKLNEVQKVTDMAYVPVIMSDGSIGQIAKADLASVVAEQMTKRYNVIVGQETTFEIERGLFLIQNASNSTDYDVVLLDSSGEITVLHQVTNNQMSYGTIVEGKVCLLKKDGKYIKKNQWNLNAYVYATRL